MGTPVSASCLILGAGEVLSYQGLRERLSGRYFIICADGGLRHCAPLGLVPHLLVGDFDSSGTLPDAVPKVALSPHKNYTDTKHAAEEAVARGYRNILFAGVTGGRLDHTLANLQLLAGCAKDGLVARATDGITDLYALAATPPAQGLLELAPRQGHYFSLLSMVDACEGVTIQGGKYPLHDYPLSSLAARAVSNEFTGVPVRITLQGGALIVVVTPMDHS